MGKILSDFPNLPADDHPERAKLYAGVYADLESRKLAVPSEPADTIKRDALLAHLQQVAGELVKAEVAANPAAKDKTAQVAADVLNKPTETAVSGKTAVKTVTVAPVSTITLGLPYAPNALTPEDITEALKEAPAPAPAEEPVVADGKDK